MQKYLFILLAFSSLLIMGASIDLDNLFSYSTSDAPPYITKDNSPASNPISDQGATLGRVLFYDKALSLNETIACASCHKQEFAFSDTAQLSSGLTGGLTGRHAMRLVNARFAEEVQFFWDERAISLEDQTTRPIQDHVEMGFSGTNGDPSFDSLIHRLEQISRYQRLFPWVFGDSAISEVRIQEALSQFIRSIESFDSRYDMERATVANDGMPFPNFTNQENQGKQLFIQPPGQGGAGCQGCHRAPEFDIDPNTRNNGVVSVAGDSTAIDITNTRAPSLRDLINPDGLLNGPLMHNGSMSSLEEVIEHYDSIVVHPMNTNLDPRLAGGPGPGGQQPQNLQLTINEKEALVAFLKTLTGSNLYTDEKWSDPFDSVGNLLILPLDTIPDTTTTSLARLDEIDIQLYPNPVRETLTIEVPTGEYTMSIFQSNGALVTHRLMSGTERIDVSQFPKGILFVRFVHHASQSLYTKKIVVR